jgi:diguanylate cyclase (GGDEF)-like protein/PAS domain S-box-containing protein
LSSTWNRSRQVAPTVIVAIAGIVASIFAWDLILSSEDRTFTMDYARRADNQAIVLQSGISEYLDKLYSVRALFDSSSRTITRDQFESFSNALLVNRTAILNLSWIPRVTRDERAAHERSAISAGVPDYHIREIGPVGSLPIAPERDEYFPKFYSTETRTSPAYGLDNNDGGAREEALAHIRDANVLSISPPLLLHIGNGARRGYWAALPVYARGLPHATVDERRRNLIGYVQGVFQIGVMIDTIFSGITAPARLYLFAPNSTVNDPPVYFTSYFGTGPTEPRSQKDLVGGLHRSSTLNFGDIRWPMVVTPEPAYWRSINHERSSVVLMGGLLLSGIVVTLMWVVRRNSQKLHLTNDQLRHGKIILDAALENMSQGLCMFDRDGRIMLFNKRYAQWMGLPPNSLEGLSLLELIKYRKSVGEFTGDPEEFFAQVVRAARDGKSSTRVIETSARRALRVIEQPMQDGGWVSTMEDITEWRENQAQISYMAHHDGLTGLVNRTQLVKKMKDALAILPLGGMGIAVHFIDLDRFKNVNDTLGHDSGDSLLKTVAGRLLAVTRVDDVVGRLGGDEFVVVQARVSSKDQAEEFARRLASVLIAPVKLGEQAFVATVSIGVALAPADGATPERLLKSADLALYKAKAAGRNCIRSFQVEMDAELQTRIDTRKGGLRRGVA